MVTSASSFTVALPACCAAANAASMSAYCMVVPSMVTSATFAVFACAAMLFSVSVARAGAGRSVRHRASAMNALNIRFFIRSSFEIYV